MHACLKCKFIILKPSCNVDKLNLIRYHTRMKKLISVFALVLALGVWSPSSALAQEQICPQPYGGGVVCGVKTHEPVETGLGENLALVGALALGASGFILFLAKRNSNSIKLS